MGSKTLRRPWMCPVSCQVKHHNCWCQHHWHMIALVTPSSKHSLKCWAQSLHWVLICTQRNHDFMWLVLSTFMLTIIHACPAWVLSVSSAHCCQTLPHMWHMIGLQQWCEGEVAYDMRISP